MYYPVEQSGASPIRLVVIKDHNLTRIGLNAILRREEDINVIGITPNAQEGLQLAADQQPDVVLLDIVLPDMDGVEATLKIKALDTRIKVLMNVPAELENQILASLAAGADGYCTQDKKPGELLAILRAVARGAPWLDPEMADVALKTMLRSQPDQGNPKLNAEELAVLKHVAEGQSYTQIATLLVLRPQDVCDLMSRILGKLATQPSVQAAAQSLEKFS